MTKRIDELSEEEISERLQLHRPMPAYIPGTCVDCVFFEAEFASPFEAYDFAEDVAFVAGCARYPPIHRKGAEVCHDDWCGEFRSIPLGADREDRLAGLARCVTRHFPPRQATPRAP